jgi:hypothetical protein
MQKFNTKVNAMEEQVQKQIAKLATLKLKPYRKFVRNLLEIEEQGIVFEKDYRELRDRYRGLILPYLKDAGRIMDSLTAIGRCVGIGNENSRLQEELQKPVIAIINILMENLGLGDRLEETVIKELEKAEVEIFPRLFRQAIKEALDNVLVNHSDYCLLNRGDFVQERDGEYIVFSFINDHPQGCKIIIGPFSDKATEILFLLYVPRYIQVAVPELAANDREPDSLVDINIENREMPLSVSMPLKDSCLIELEQEDSYNGYISSFALGSGVRITSHRRNYVEVAFALGQRAKYIFLHACIPLEAMHLHTYIEKLQKIDPFRIYPSIPWELSRDGDIVYLEGC